MADSLALAIQDQAISFLTGEISLPDFQDWLVGATWNVEERGEPHATDMAYDIKLALAEHSRGDISLAELHKRVSEVVATTVRVVNIGTDDDATRISTLDTISKPVIVELELQTVHTRFATASW